MVNSVRAPATGCIQRARCHNPFLLPCTPCLPARPPYSRQVTIQLGQQLAENSIQLSGLLNLVTLTGATNPLPGAPPVRWAY